MNAVPKPSKTVLKKRPNPTKHAPVAGGKTTAAVPRQGAEDDTKFTALEIPRGKLSAEMQAYFDKCQEKLGYVPNVLRSFGFDNGKLQAFVDYRQELVQNAENLSKLEIEMIATVVSAQNRCFYCITVHGNSVRAALRRSDPRRDDGDELSRRAAVQAPARDARFRRQAHGQVVGGRGRGPREAAPRRASPTATSGTSPRSRRSTT